MRLAIFLILMLCIPAPARAETEAEARPHMDALRKLSINRSLLARAEDEYEQLSAERPAPGTLAAKKLDNLRYKIQALAEDAERLRKILPPEELSSAPQAESRFNVKVDRQIEARMNEVHSLHEKALGYVANENYEQAEKAYEEIILVSPDDDEAFLLLGHTALAAGNYKKAASSFNSALHINPENMREIPRLYENILLENPSDDRALSQLGFAHLLLGNVGAARTAFEEALKINPANETAQRGLLELSVSSA